MKKRSVINNFAIILFLMMFLVPFVSSQIYDLKIPTNETACNITITFQNSTDIITNKIMSLGVGYGNYSFNYPLSGEYYYYSDCGSGTFNIGGETLTTGKSILYFLVTLFAFLIFGILVYIFLGMDGSNPRSNETGDYLSINYKKYVKTALFPLVYVTFLWAFNFIIGLSNNYLGLTLYSNTLGFIFMILTKLIFPIILLTVIWEIVLLIKDSNVEKEYKSLWSQY